MYDIDLDDLETAGQGACDALEGYAITEDLTGTQMATIAGTSTLFVYGGYHLGNFLSDKYAAYKGIEDEEVLKNYRFVGGSAGIVTGLGVGYISGKIGGSKIEQMIEERRRQAENEDKDEA
ncbi:MAG: hypothetical protein QF415_05590 [Candidatus Undinarchaeales archaeon]|jgi:hypothetical protein|nr:hypothetical protein [Candidatus Undinarchaeales archaeon]MDP7491947.1 hypothetical protein [Candidatus Undinarchaeales archaeon]